LEWNHGDPAMRHATTATALAGRSPKDQWLAAIRADETAATSAATTLAAMYACEEPGDRLMLCVLTEASANCPECTSELTSIEAGYDRYGHLSLEEDKVLCIEGAGFSDDGDGPHYLHCNERDRAFELPEMELDYR
jgi:hypothetical protein